MVDFAELLLRQFQYWRASLVVGISIFLSAAIALASPSSQALSSDTAQGQAVTTILGSLQRGEMVALVIVLTLALGSILCSVAYWATFLAYDILLRRIDLSSPVSEWTRVQRALCPIGGSEILFLQQSMMATDEYIDLPRADRRFAYSKFTRDVVRNPAVLPFIEGPFGEASLMSITNSRLYGGLVLPGTLLAFQLARSISIPYGTSILASAIVFAFLALMTLGESRKTYSLLTRAGSESGQLLAAHARLALNASRRCHEIAEARGTTA